MKPNIIALFQQFMGNPAQMMQRSGLNIPQNIANDPNFTRLRTSYTASPTSPR